MQTKLYTRQHHVISSYVREGNSPNQQEHSTTPFFSSSFSMYGASARFRAMASPISFLQPYFSFAAAYHGRVYSKSTASKQHPLIYFWSFPRTFFLRNIAFWGAGGGGARKSTILISGLPTITLLRSENIQRLTSPIDRKSPHCIVPTYPLL
jgi:hypothetical protein